VRKIISIVLTLGVILGLTAFAAPVAAAPCVCPTTMDSTDVLTPPFCAGASQTYTIGTVDPFVLPISLVPGTDWISVDFPAGTDLSSVVFGGVLIDGSPLTAASQLVVSGAHLEARIPVALGPGLLLAGTGHSIVVAGVINTATAGTYCLYIDYKESCAGGGCAAVQFACGTLTISPATKVVDFHFDFSPAYTGIAEDYIPAFLAGGAPTAFNLILRDENGGCNDPCTTPSAFWFQVTKCPLGETITFTAPDAVVYVLTNADVVAATKYSQLAAWAGWPPPDVSWLCDIAFSSPGDYEICFYLQCPATGCPTCGGPTIIADACLGTTAYQYMDSYKVLLEDKWNLVSLPLFPFDTDIAAVLGSMDDISQLVSVWYFGQCEDPAPDAGVWHTSAYSGGAFVGDVTEIQTGKAYWIRTLHSGETGYVAGAGGFWVFGTSSIMPDPTGVDMGYFDVCEGWNMVGFKAPWVAGTPIPELDGFNGVGYLWNFNLVLGGVHYGLIYDWVPAPLPGYWTTWLPGTLNMLPGAGYWIPFDGDAEIYPSA
jgi:hypothetical protein